MPFVRTMLLASACGGFVACASNDSKEDDREYRQKEDWSWELLRDKKSIGMFLKELDTSLKAWNNLLLSARNDLDRQKALAIEDDVAFRSKQIMDSLLEQLELGAPYNRQVAALALGFTGDEKVQGPLLSALDDPQPVVVANAILGLGVLARSDTPMTRIVELLEEGIDERIRSNAAWTIRELLAAGVEDPAILPSAQAALHDSDPGVRAQAALILARLIDTTSLKTLELQLYDEVNLPASAASRALTYIGANDPHEKGECARALSACLGKVNPTVREAVLRDLQRLSGKNYGRDQESWVEWAQRLD